ncbi:MAG TPA: hypothetical protein VEL76_06130 [Gemmataceae bacterium]|nr:hypothetical protein [Gemmataceae bacterium]
MRPAAHVSSLGLPSHVPASLLPGVGSPTTLVEGTPAWRANVDFHACCQLIAPPGPAMHGPETCYLGSLSVLINNQMAVREGDLLMGAGPPNQVMLGCATVLIGDVGGGLADAANMAEYSADFKALASVWGTLTPAQRQAELGRIIHKQLAKSGVPAVGVNPANIAPASGQLDFPNWNLDIDQGVLNSPTLTPNQQSDLGNTIYHEGRHAEQWYAAAQSQAAAPGATGPGVATGMGLPAHVGNAAAANPLPANSSPQAVLGQSVHQSAYGSGAADRNALLATVLANPNDPTSYARYQALPEEQDAFRTGDATGGCP